MSFGEKYTYTVSHLFSVGGIQASVYEIQVCCGGASDSCDSTLLVKYIYFLFTLKSVSLHSIQNYNLSSDKFSHL